MTGLPEDCETAFVICLIRRMCLPECEQVTLGEARNRRCRKLSVAIHHLGPNRCAAGTSQPHFVTDLRSILTKLSSILTMTATVTILDVLLVGSWGL